MENHQILTQNKNNYRKRNKIAFPEYDGKGFSYDMSATDGCIIIPLFYSFEGVFPDYHLNAISWAFHSWLVNSNVIEKQVPLFYYIEDRLWEQATEGLKALGIPEERCVHWTAPPRLPEYQGQYHGQKLFATVDPFFDAYDTVVMVEGDIYCATAIQEKFDVTHLFGKHTDPTKYAVLGMTDALDRTARYNLYYTIETDDIHAYWKALVKEHLDIETDKVHRSDGGFGAWVPQHLDPTFKNFVEDFAKYFGSEEDILSLFVQWSGERLNDLQDMWDIKMRRPGPSIEADMPAHKHVLFHLRPHRIPDEDHREYFRHTIGQHKELPSG